MKKFWIGTGIGLAAAGAIWGALIAWQCGRPTLSSQWIADDYAAKRSITEKTVGRRIVIVAGSNALFGIDSGMVERAYGLPTINYAVNAGLLLPYTLLKSKEVLRRGDIVLMPLEYHMLTYDGMPNSQMIDQIWSRDPHYFFDLSLSEQWNMIWNTPVQRVVEGFWAQGGKMAMCGPYGAENLDKHGDQTHTSQAEAVQWSHDWEALAKDLPRRLAPKESGDTELAQQWLAEYAAWAKKEGICLIAIPSTMMDQPLYHNDPKERAFYEGIPAKLTSIGIPYVGNPYDFMYGREAYFNTDYHLIDTARTMHTRKIIEMLGRDLRGECR